MASTIKQMGRHRVTSVDEIPQPPADPKKFLAADLSWRDPAVTVNYQSFVPVTDVVAGQALHMTDDGRTDLCDHDALDQRGRYVGLVVSDTLADDTTFVQTVGLVDNAAWNWTPGHPVFVGKAGAVTQEIINTGYRQCVGIARTPTSIFLGTYSYRVCSESSDGFFRRYAENGGAGGVSLDYASPQDIRDGVIRDKVISPWAMGVVRQQDIADYGVVPGRLAVAEDVTNGVAGKLITADVLKLVLATFSGGGGAEITWATTNEITVGTVDDKAIHPKALKPVLDAIRNAEITLNWATTGDINAGTAGDKIVSPLALKAILEALHNSDAILSGRIPDSATDGEVSTGSRTDVYVSPATLRVALNTVKAMIPIIANAAEIVSGATDRVITAAQLKDLKDALTNLIPVAATTADVEAGIDENKYINVVQLQKALDTIDIGDLDLSDIENRIKALEDAELAFATLEEAKAGVIEDKIISPKTLKAIVDEVALVSAPFATVEEALDGLSTKTAVSPATVQAMIAAFSTWKREDTGIIFPGD